ncbi:5'-nucleotidase C-terminal domain-containing protein [Sandaracinus amylolyticus]|uniref:5'-nucleotidase n=1 Tax=Sandaracinus amylolyticus TaxID=927083 RepID=A0A0F6YG31_9BACT|nr:5'-nucleotidase C-terminal domain-containing protein [Sandaracinus amylolyticus]AKF04335.1 5'-nucleotidase [Sandaracinus amylolyticus]
MTLRARLRIVAVNDVYSLDHLPRLVSLVRHHATHDPADRMLVVVAGDFVAPSVLSSLDSGRGMVDCLRHVPITHAILGNHEDDIEVDQLRARLHELRATVLLSNVHGLDESFPKTEVLDVAGVRVGLVGVTSGEPSLYRRPPFGGARVDPANETARRLADELLASGCACVLPITHQRADQDRALARTTPPFPVILGGHEHDGLLERIGATWLAKAPSDAVRATVIDLVWTSGTFPEVHARFEAVADHPEDDAMRARVDQHLSLVRDLETATVAILPPGVTLSSIGSRVRQTSMGTLICSRLRDALEADGAIFNGGGIRGARKHRGRLTYGDLQGELPFDNEVVVAPLPGAVLRDAIATSRAHAPVESGGFLQVDDRMIVDARHQLVQVAGAPFDPARIYRIALVRSFFDGMDEIEPLVRFAAAHPDEIPTATTGREVKAALVSAFCTTLWAQLGGFDAIDRDDDGAVTRDEVAGAIGRAVGAPSESAARVVIDALDRDDDGRLTPDETGDER